MVNERWSNLDKDEVPDDEMRARIESNEPDLSDPFTTASAFLAGLEDPQQYGDALHSIIHPATEAAWGDFTEASERLSEIQNWGLGSQPKRAESNPNVSYAAILRGVDQTFRSNDDQVVMTAAVLTLVWSESRGMWLVFALGDYVRPEQIPPV